MTKLKKEKAQIIFLQETHLTQSEHDKLKKIWLQRGIHKRGNNFNIKHD